jgi:radical SAM-linked protein
VPDQPEQQSPPVQRLRVRYAKRGRLRFTSHRDFARAFERALLRARVPMAYSSGFTPHPRISYAGAAPTGAASEAEYLELGLARLTDPRDVARELDAALPPGLDVLDVVVARGGALADRLQASRWRVVCRGVDPETAAGAVAAFLNAAEVPVERMTKRGLRRFDARAAVLWLRAGRAPVEEPAEPAGGGAQLARPIGAGACAILDMVLRHGTPAVRPDDVLAGLREVAGLDAGPAPRYERLAQGPLDEGTGTVGDPLAPDRDAR